MPPAPLSAEQTACIAMLRFVASKTAGAAPDTQHMAALLNAAADEFEHSGRLVPPSASPELSARALAGFAAFLQKQILPEAVAHTNATAERQLRFAIDLAMETVHQLLTRIAPLPETEQPS